MSAAPGSTIDTRQRRAPRERRGLPAERSTAGADGVPPVAAIISSSSLANQTSVVNLRPLPVGDCSRLFEQHQLSLAQKQIHSRAAWQATQVLVATAMARPKRGVCRRQRHTRISFVSQHGKTSLVTGERCGATIYFTILTMIAAEVLVQRCQNLPCEMHLSPRSTNQWIISRGSSQHSASASTTFGKSKLASNRRQRKSTATLPLVASLRNWPRSRHCKRSKKR